MTPITDTTPSLTPRALLGRLRDRRTPGATMTIRRESHAAVHFHRGPQGAPAVCDDPRCVSPRLDV